MLFRNFVALSFAVTTTVLFAASDVDTRLSQLEKQMKEVRVETAIDNYGALTASARDDVDGNGWYILFGPVYYHTRVGGTEFVYTVNNPVITLPSYGRVKDMHFKWDWGIRAAIGYNFIHDEWDAVLSYLWFSTSGSKNVDAGLNGSLIPLRVSPGIMNGCAGFNDDADRIYSRFAKSLI